MNTQHSFKMKHRSTRVSIILLTAISMVLLLPACTRQPQPARIEEITFQSGEF